ncbi:hypothetical protein CCMA1212_001107 [Trichoderma ghanense]|uniref:Uncharacterized protein n=1 Tax=Trichoderma ghanense TaxID=65468 RepID=A0ABY2HFH0_9HYPO
MMQSAAMGGYGAAVLTGAAQTAGGAVAGVGGLVTLMSRKPQSEQQSKEQPSDEQPVNEQPSDEEMSNEKMSER